jgi:[protein-PII] uridylyltransferase
VVDRRQHLIAPLHGGRLGSGRSYVRGLAEITDDWMVEVFDAAMGQARPSTGRVALLAVGGYGRGELAPYSDLDLLLVHDVKARKVRGEIEPLASAIWYPLWDAGVKLGHAVRSVREQLQLCGEDLDSATSLLTARPLAGDDELAAEVVAAGSASWTSNAALVVELRERVGERKRTAGDVAYRLEPDLKDGHGGLRDVQSLWWAAAAQLELRAEDSIELDACYATLLQARVALHLTTDRASEVLRLEDQDAVAELGGWSDADDMMADVAAAGRTIAWLVDENWGRYPRGAGAPPGGVDGAADTVQHVAPGIVLRNGEIDLADGIDPAGDPTLTLRAAVAAARTGTRIARRTLDQLSSEVEPWPGSWPVGATDELVALLLEGHAAIPVLEALDQRELFARFLPEWEPCRSKPQRNAYHRYTVDRHLWEAAANASRLVDRVSRPDLLVIGALLHDIGKGYPGDHTEVGVDLVSTIGPRLGFSAADVDVLAQLVEQHLLLPDIAMRRDLTDEATIRQVADAVASVDTLELLHALTEADSLATGPSAWGPWKAELVGDLVARVRHVLGGGDVSEVTWRLFPDAPTLEAMAEGGVSLSRANDYITVVSPDAAFTFSRVAGVLSLHGLDVLSAQAHSDEHGMAASRFRVSMPEGGLQWRKIKVDLDHALRYELALEARLAERASTYRRRRRTQAQPPTKPAVNFIDAASSNATVIEVRAVSRIGILHRITKTLGELGLDIRHASVQSIGLDVVDTFYLRTSDGRLVTDKFHRREIERALLHAVTGDIAYAS